MEVKNPINSCWVKAKAPFLFKMNIKQLKPVIKAAALVCGGTTRMSKKAFRVIKIECISCVLL